MIKFLKAAIVLSLIYGVAAQAAQIANFNQPHVRGQFLVTTADAVDSTALQAAWQKVGGRVEHRFLSGNHMLLSIPTKSDLEAMQALEALQRLDGVVRIEANTIVRAVRTPNDEKYAEQYGLRNEAQTGGVAGADIKAEQAWDVSTGSRDVVVAVIDTGIDFSHPDLAPNQWFNSGEVGLDAEGNDKRSNGIDDDKNGFIDDYQGWDFVNNDNDPKDDNGHSHGTHCAGVIGAVGDNGIGIAGINWNVSMVGMKFLDAAGSGTLANAVKAVEYATLLGVNLTSNSWGGGGFSKVMSDAIDAAERKGILFIAAAGNAGLNTDISPYYPSSYPQDIVIGVGATDHADVAASFSNYGLVHVDISAPGVDILSTLKGGEYGELSGTSMATPHVAGAAAMILAQYPGMRPQEVKSRLLNSADLVATLSPKNQVGGRLNLVDALEDDQIPPGPAGNISIKETRRQSMTVEWQAAGDDRNSGFARRYEVRRSRSPIRDQNDWAQATPVALSQLGARSQMEGTLEFDLSGFRFNEEGYFAVRAYDNVGNIGDISASVAYRMKRVNIMSRYLPGQSTQGLVFEGTWGEEDVEGVHKIAFSDTPHGNYEPNADQSLLLPRITTMPAGLTLVFDSRTDLERGYDFGLVEIKTNLEDWKVIQRYTDFREWRTMHLPLKEHVKDAEWFEVRFRMTSDTSIEHDGWWVDDIYLVTD